MKFFLKLTDWHLQIKLSDKIQQLLVRLPMLMAENAMYLLMIVQFHEQYVEMVNEE